MRRGLRITALTLSVPLLLLIGYLGLLVSTGNFHVITNREAYRSAQLSKENLSLYIRRYKIGSVLNLRGEHRADDWYKDEIKTCESYGVSHYDLALTSTRKPSVEDVKKLLEIFGTAPRPVLIHCQYGFDRSGLVAAMWKVIVDKEPKSEARRQLSLLYGHLPLFGRDAMDHFFDKWNPAVQSNTASEKEKEYVKD